jgi:hypothetical protein
MSALGQKQTLDSRPLMSALPPKADIDWRHFDVRFVPCVDGSELARDIFTFAELVGAAMCSACLRGSHVQAKSTAINDLAVKRPKTRPPSINRLSGFRKVGGRSIAERDDRLTPICRQRHRRPLGQGFACSGGFATAGDLQRLRNGALAISGAQFQELRLECALKLGALVRDQVGEIANVGH